VSHTIHLDALASAELLLAVDVSSLTDHA